MREIIPFCKDIVFKTSIASITSISLEHEEKIIDGEVSGDFIIFGDYKIHNDTTEKENFKYRLPFTAIIPDNIDLETVDVDVENFTYEQVEEDVLRVNIDFSVKGEEKEEVIEEERYEEVSESVELNEDIIKELNEEIDHFIESKKNREENKSDDGKTEENSESTNMEIESLEPEILELNDNYDTRKITSIEEKNKETEIDDTDISFVAKNNEEKNIDRNDDSVVINLPNKINKEKEDIVQMEQTEVKEVVSEYVTYHIHVIKDNETVDGILKNYGANMEVVKEYNDISNIKVGDKIIIPEYLDE